MDELDSLLAQFVSHRLGKVSCQNLLVVGGDVVGGDAVGGDVGGGDVVGGDVFVVIVVLFNFTLASSSIRLSNVNFASSAESS